MWTTTKSPDGYGSLARSRRVHPPVDHEAEFRAIWTGAWDTLRIHLTSQFFLDHLGPHPTEAVFTALVERQIDVVTSYLASASHPMNEAIAAWGVGDVTKARGRSAVAADKNPFRPGTDGWRRWEARQQPPAVPALDPFSRYSDLAKKLALNMAERVTAEMKTTVRGIISKAFKAKIPPAEIAKRVGNVIGLNDRWAKAVENLRARMTANHLPHALVTRRANAYGRELMVKRGLMVARTEMARVMNAAEFEDWQIKEDRGELRGQIVVKYWVTREGACEECVSAADDMASGVSTSVLGLGTTFATVYGDVLYPPLHAHCRCSIRYEVRER